jgi:non-specific serine/threonine protein kinase
LDYTVDSHVDLQLKNLLLPTPSPKALSEFEEREIREPSARKVLDDRTIYVSSRFPTGTYSEVQVGLQGGYLECRYGCKSIPLAQSPSARHEQNMLILRMKAWDIVNPNPLIDGRNADGIFDDRVHLAELVGLLGAPPAEFLEGHHLSSVIWNKSGNWKDLAPIPGKTLQSLATDIRGERGRQGGILAVAPISYAIESRRPAGSSGPFV